MTHPTRMELDMILLDAQFAERDAVRSHIDGCARCTADLAAMRADAESFTANRLVRSSGVIEKRLGRRTWFVWALAPVVAAACFAVFWVRPYTGTKGDSVVRFLVGPPDAMQRAVGEARLRAGEALAFETQGAAGRSLFIVSIRAGAPVAVYAPADGTMSMPVTSDGPLADAIILDDPGVERVFAIVTDQPLALSTVQQAAAAIVAGGESTVRSSTTLPVASSSQSSILVETLPP